MRHLDDAELVRYVDGEHDPAGETRRRAHVEACDRCGRAIETIRSQSRLFSGWLERAAFEADLPDLDTGTGLTLGAPAHGRREATATGLPAPPWLKAAVIVLLLAAPLAAFPGLRGWVVDQVGRATGPAAVEDTSSWLDDGPLVRFTPGPGSFTVRVEAARPAGTLLLERSDGDDAAVRLAGTAEPVVSARSLRIRGGEPDAAHRLALPASVTGVVVIVGQRVIRVTGAELDAGRVVDLDG